MTDGNHPLMPTDPAVRAAWEAMHQRRVEVHEYDLTETLGPDGRARPEGVTRRTETATVFCPWLIDTDEDG